MLQRVKVKMKVGRGNNEVFREVRREGVNVWRRFK